jgi:hypothetical protein
MLGSSINLSTLGNIFQDQEEKQRSLVVLEVCGKSAFSLWDMVLVDSVA